jgi:transposase IS116/IS110/IS902 family protein
VTRFATPGQLASWAGLTPRHRESDVKVTRGHATKQGSRLLRWALIEAIQHAPAGYKVREAKDAIIARRGRQARNIASCRRPEAAHPGLLRAARRPDPLPARTGPGRVSAPGPAGRAAVCLSVPRPGGADVPLTGPARP